MTKTGIARLAVLIVAIVGAAELASQGATPPSDLDQFMGKVLARRDQNWKKLQQYVLDERERIEVRNASGAPLWGDLRDYTWFVRDGFFVRSPIAVNGVTIGEAERRKYEAEFLARAKARDAGGRRGAPPADHPATPPADQPNDIGGLLAQTRQPEFIDSAYFLRFKFEEGKYALTGHETFENRDVLRIEYYPARLFSHEQDAQARRNAPGRGVTTNDKDVDAAIERLMNKVSLVTLWVDPASNQIVKYTFDNVNLDFLPAAWLVRMDDLKATMTMGQPFKDVWLPRDVDMSVSAMLAVGSFAVRYHLDYHDYREATTSGRILPPAAR